MTPASRRRAVRKLLWSSVRARPREWGWLAVWSVVEALPAYFSGRLVARAIDHGFLVRDQTTGFVWLGVLAASIVVGAWATRQTYRWLAAIVEPFRDELATLAVTGALRRSTVAGASPDTAGVARLTQQVEFVREAYAGVLFVLQSFVVTTISALVGLFTLLPVVLVFVLPPLVLGLGLFVAVLPRMALRQRESILADEAIAESTSELAAGHRDVVASGGEEVVGDTIDRRIDAQVRATNALARLTAVRTLAVALGGLLPLVLVLVGASWLRRHGATTGVILGALTYILQGVHPPLQTLVRGLGGTGLWLLVTLRRIVEATETTASVAAEAGGNGRPPVVPAHHGVHFGKVTFRYGPWAEPVVRGLHFMVPAGAHLAIVGPSGAGKSTLANLISGILEPEDGELRLGGVPLGALDVRTRARHRALIPQEAYVFPGTLGENLAYLREDVSIAELDSAVSLLGLGSLVERIGGYEVRFDPSELSAGERQLVTLVRAYVSEARLMVLDEATCHLDPRSEARVEAAFADRFGTLIVIAHRITSALRAERILLLDGRQAVLGTHKGLLTGSQLYRDLVGHWDSGSITSAGAACSSSLSCPREDTSSLR